MSTIVNTSDLDGFVFKEVLSEYTTSGDLKNKLPYDISEIFLTTEGNKYIYATGMSGVTKCGLYTDSAATTEAKCKLTDIIYYPYFEYKYYGDSLKVRIHNRFRFRFNFYTNTGSAITYAYIKPKSSFSGIKYLCFPYLHLLKQSGSWYYGNFNQSEINLLPASSFSAEVGEDYFIPYIKNEYVKLKIGFYNTVTDSMCICCGNMYNESDSSGYNYSEIIQIKSGYRTIENISTSEFTREF